MIELAYLKLADLKLTSRKLTSRKLTSRNPKKFYINPTPLTLTKHNYLNKKSLPKTPTSIKNPYKKILKNLLLKNILIKKKVKSYNKFFYKIKKFKKKKS